MKPVKLCLLIPSLQAGGMERVMSELANFFVSKKEVEVHLIMYGMAPVLFYTLDKKVIVHQPKWEFNYKRRGWHTIRRMFYLRSEVKKIAPTTVLSFGEYWNSFALLALWGLKLPFYVSDRCQPDKSLGRLHDFLRKLLYPKATGIIAQTEKAKDIYTKEKLNRNIEVIGNPIRRIVEDVTIKREKIVLSVGRLIKSKHHDLLIDLFLKCNRSDWKLVIVGGNAIQQDGYSRLSQKVKEMNADDQVILAGNQSDVDSYYRKASIFAFTSSSEGFPNVIGEAMSAGLPVVAFDCIAGPSDMIVDEENGFLVPLFDEIRFQHKLVELMDNDELVKKMGLVAKDTIAHFSVESIAQQFYETILKKA